MKPSLDPNGIRQPEILEDLPKVGDEIGRTILLDDHREVDSHPQLRSRAELGQDLRSQPIPEFRRH